MGSIAKDMRARIEARQQAKQPQQDASFGEGAMQGGAEGLLGNAMGLLELPMRASRGIGNATRKIMGYQDQPYPQEGLLGLPSGRESAAGLDSAMSLLGVPNTSGNFQENMDRRDNVQQQAPMGQMAGGVLGDVATLATGRAPLMGGRSGGVFDQKIEGTIDNLSKYLGKKAKDTGTARFSKDIADSETFRDIARGLGRAGETSIEGLTLAAIQGGDPMEAAAMSAGTQMAASLVNTGIGGMFHLIPKMTGGSIKAPTTLEGKVAALALYAGVMGNLVSLAQQFSPGENSIFAADDAGFNKVASMLIVGATLGVTGSRSGPEGMLSAFPKAADFMHSIPRTAMTSFYADMSKDESGLSKQVLETIKKAPSSFSGSQIDELTKGFLNGDFTSRVNKLAEDQKFRDILDAPDPRLSGVPKK